MDNVRDQIGGPTKTTVKTNTQSLLLFFIFIWLCDPDPTQQPPARRVGTNNTSISIDIYTLPVNRK